MSRRPKTAREVRAECAAMVRREANIVATMGGVDDASALRGLARAMDRLRLTHDTTNAQATGGEDRG